MSTVTRDERLERDQLIVAIDRALDEGRTIELHFGPAKYQHVVAVERLEDFPICGHSREYRITQGERSRLICAPCYRKKISP
jgi:hypothetical protein